MSYLNDKEIRQNCLMPTHHVGTGHLLFSEVDGVFYNCLGQSIPNPDANFIRSVSEQVISDYRKPMIEPFVPVQVRYDDAGEKVISYGTSSMGYDVRLAPKFKIFTNLYSAVIDPLNMPEAAYHDHEGDYVIIPPNSYVLGHTIEYFRLPNDVGAICVGKSTYARSGCAVNVTPIEPGFEGQVVIEIANQTPLPMKVYANQGIAQFIFLKGDACEISYADRAGKYQGQTGIQTALG